MYVKFNLMPDTYLVVTTVFGVGWVGGNRRRISKGELFKTYKEKEKNNNLLAAEDMLRTTVS